MKKLFIATICAFMALSVSAQRASSSSSSFFSTEKAESGVRFGIRAGLNLSTLSLVEDNHTYTTDSRAAWHVGAIVDIPLMQSLYVQSGLYFMNKGGKESEGEAKVTYSPMYLEIPVLASYRYDFGSAAELQINVGPYFAYGVGGKEKMEHDGEEESDDFFHEDSAKKFDCGLQFGAGVTFASHYYLGFAYDLGLSNIAKNSGDSDGKIKNRSWMISLGYTF